MIEIKKLIIKFLLATSIFTSPFIQKVYATEGSGNSEEMKEYAKSVTIGIETPGSSGSGILIGKKGNRYYFLTASHVVLGDPQKEEFWAYSIAGGDTKSYQITSFEKPDIFADKDLAIGSFVSEDDIPVALILSLEGSEYRPGALYVPIRKYNGKTYNSDWGIQGSIFVGGVSIPTGAIPVPIMRTSTIEMQDRVEGNRDGYEAIYSVASTVPGMSGGPVYGSRVCRTKEALNSARFSTVTAKHGMYTGVIAMHGRSEQYLNSGGRSGTSLGIPLDLFFDFFGKNADKYGILTGEQYINQAAKLCINSKN
tara:strand:- start:281 stop:1210 length:930 start_codon:yes stop_codon:yes gene_type:complete